MRFENEDHIFQFPYLQSGSANQQNMAISKAWNMEEVKDWNYGIESRNGLKNEVFMFTVKGTNLASEHS